MFVPDPHASRPRTFTDKLPPHSPGLSAALVQDWLCANGDATDSVSWWRENLGHSQKGVISSGPNGVWGPRGKNCHILKPPKYNLVISAYLPKLAKSVFCVFYKNMIIVNILPKAA